MILVGFCDNELYFTLVLKWESDGVGENRVQRTPVNLIGLVREKNITISGLSDYPVDLFY